MKLFDIVAGKVVIHNDTLGIPCFKTIWEASEDKSHATNVISYIVLKNKPDSPYVKQGWTPAIEAKLKKQFFKNEKYKLTAEELICEEEYINFFNTLSVQLLRSYRGRLEDAAKSYEAAKGELMDNKDIKELFAAGEKLGKLMASIESLEQAVLVEELTTKKVRGDAELNYYEIPK